MLKHLGLDWRGRSGGEAEAPLLDWCHGAASFWLGRLRESGGKRSERPSPPLQMRTGRRRSRAPGKARRRPACRAVSQLQSQPGGRRALAQAKRTTPKQAEAPPLIDLPTGLLTDTSASSSPREAPVAALPLPAAAPTTAQIKHLLEAAPTPQQLNILCQPPQQLAAKPGWWQADSAQAPRRLSDAELPVSSAACDACHAPAHPGALWHAHMADRLQLPGRPWEQAGAAAAPRTARPSDTAGSRGATPKRAGSQRSHGSPRSLGGGPCRSEATERSSLLGSSLTHSRLGLAAKHASPRVSGMSPHGSPFWPGGRYTLQPHMLWPMHVERISNALRQWRRATKWLLLWLALSGLILLHSAVLLLSLDYSLFAIIMTALFAWAGVLGMLGSARALLGLCLARHKGPDAALQSLQLKAVELLAFTTGMLSAGAAAIHCICVQIFLRDARLPACDPGDSRCAQAFNMVIIVIMVATAVLYTCHAAVSGIVAYSARAAGCQAAAPAPPGLTFQELPGSPLAAGSEDGWD